MWATANCARLQDRPQRHARRRDREPDRDHALGQQVGVPRHAFLAFMNNSVMGSMFTALQVAGAGQSRLDDDVHAGTAAQGPRPRPRARPRARRADAGDRGDPRGGAGAFRRGHAQAGSRGVSEKDFAALMETMALMAGMTLRGEDKPVPTGLDEFRRPRAQRAVGGETRALSSGYPLSPSIACVRRRSLGGSWRCRRDRA